MNWLHSLLKSSQFFQMNSKLEQAKGLNR
jgi:hypothetical protein